MGIGVGEEGEEEIDATTLVDPDDVEKDPVSPLISYNLL